MPLSLYELERPALKKVSTELRSALSDNDSDALSSLLELGEAMKVKLEDTPRLVDLFLLPDDHPNVAPLMASLRRVSRKRAMTKVMTSTHSSLEGRLRAYDVLRDDPAIAKSVDRLLNPNRLPWYLRRSNAVCGWIDGPEREQLVNAMRKLRPSLTDELIELLDGLDEVVGDAVLHDGM